MERIRDYEAMAKLNLPDAQREIVNRHADQLIESFHVLENIDTRNTEPLVSVLDLKNILREDIVNQTISREELLETAPEQYDGYFQVPKTLE